MKASSTPTILNRKAGYLYHIEERFETGIVLTGTEVKSVRASKVSLAEAWVDVSDSLELWLVGAHIDEYSFGNRNNHLPAQRRKLLAHKHEILKMRKARDIKGYTLIPLRMYFHNRYAKLEVGICRGKDSRDKRHTILERDAKREVARTVKIGRAL